MMNDDAHSVEECENGTVALHQPAMVSITEAAKINKVTRQAIYVAIKQRKLRARKESKRWTISLEDLEEYRKNRYSRAKSMYNGELIFDADRGFFSVNQVAKMLGVPAQKIYYAARVGLLKAHRRGAAWVIQASDVEAYKANYLDKTVQVIKVK